MKEYNTHTNTRTATYNTLLKLVVKYYLNRIKYYRYSIHYANTK